jgi:Glycosyl hydrolase family 26
MNFTHSYHFRTFSYILLFMLSACQTSSLLRAQSLEPPPVGFYYHGVYPGGKTGAEDDLTPADIESYEQTVGKKVAWVYFSNNWYRSRAFPLATATWIRERGSIPFIRLMLRSSDENPTPDPLFTLEAITRGDFDADLKAWGEVAKGFGTPIIVEWGTEMNGYWFAWNATWNGREGGAERFRQAYRHIVQTIAAPNITWVFHVNADDDPVESWNRLEDYYPGDDVMDWLGVSVYGAQTPQDDYWTDPVEQLNAVIPRLEKLADKPIFLLEFGVTTNSPLGRASDWAASLLTALLEPRWPNIKGFSWWNETWQNDDNPAHDTDMRVQSDPDLASVFKERLESDKVIGQPIFTE